MQANKAKTTVPLFYRSHRWLLQEFRGREVVAPPAVEDAAVVGDGAGADAGELLRVGELPLQVHDPAGAQFKRNFVAPVLSSVYDAESFQKETFLN